MLSNDQENWYLFLYFCTSGTTTGNGDPLLDFLTVINFLGGSIPLVGQRWGAAAASWDLELDSFG